MSKKKSLAKSTPAKPVLDGPRADSVRETIESVVVAFLLAFLFRTFEAEAFHIPTGSMAPTLRGEHKDLLCANCGFPYQANASGELNIETNSPTGISVRECTCPNCRYTTEVADGNPQGKSYPSYSGDRLWVTKFPYQFGDPQRWDVIVFKYPGKASQNYIKRLVGLPNETLRIKHGNIYTSPPDKDEFTIARKPADRMRAMLQVVHDNDYTPEDKLVQAGWPQRWSGDDGNNSWKLQPDGKSFTMEPQPGGLQFLRYRHQPPLPSDWDAFQRGADIARLTVRPQLIKDFTFYNTNSTGGSPYEALGQHWVGDLALECQLTPGSGSGSLILELVEGERRFQCRLDVATGQARLSIDGVEDFSPVADTAVRGGGTYKVLFSNIDDELLLLVDGKLADFNGSTRYDEQELHNEIAGEADLAPVGIAAEGVPLTVEHLKVWRDIYYITTRSGSMNDHGYGDTLGSSNIKEWPQILARRQSQEFKMGPDQFMMLGDNSLRSQDSRLWSKYDPDLPAHVVTREMLIGKALFIYWPHSWGSIGRDGIWFPYFPNFSQMGFVR
ncbi:MAG: signal peptidase I [Pirellulales bacterium]